MLPAFTPPPSVNLFLNELCLLNEAVIEDEAGDFDPWLEIYNHSDSLVSLAGLSLSDGNIEWHFAPEAGIAPWGYVVVWLDGETWEGSFHASFSPGPGGGVVRATPSPGGSNEWISPHWQACTRLNP